MTPAGMGSHQSARAVTDTWLTPPEILAALGPFDLDPCAAPEPRPWPTAARHIARPDDGLTAEWHGRVWLNPPYGPETGCGLDGTFVEWSPVPQEPDLQLPLFGGTS